MEPSLEQSQAAEKAREKVIALSTRVVHSKKEKVSVTVYQKRTIRPAEGAIRMELVGLVYLPVWCVEGGNGAVVLDALRGQVVKEELFQTTKGSGEGPVGTR